MLAVEVCLEETGGRLQDVGNSPQLEVILAQLFELDPSGRAQSGSLTVVDLGLLDRRPQGLIAHAELAGLTTGWPALSAQEATASMLPSSP